MSEEIKSIQKELLICNKEMPALEEFGVWRESESSEQKKIVEEWYMNFIEHSQIKDNFCYLDLTFEIPDKGAITITFTSSNSGSGYERLLHDYVEKGHTIYLHPAFHRGYLADSSGKGKEQNFLIFKLEQTEGVIPADQSPGQIKFSNINLQHLYDRWNGEKMNSFLNSSIMEHVNEWINVHREKRDSIRSLQGKEITWILVVPVGILDNKDDFKLIGGLYLGLDNGCDENTILGFIQSILLPLITNYQRYETKRAYKNAIKSAKAAIIARNMSHNLGSHVLYYLRQYLSGDINQFNEILENIVIREDETGSGHFEILYKKETDDGKYELSHIIDRKFEVPFLRGLGSFLTYLQERQDFIASIATDSIPSYTTVNFKNFVIDNLLKDKKAIRHGNESRKEKNILLDFIAKSENTLVEIKFNGHSLSHHIPLSNEANGKYLYSYMVDLPGGVLGRQAIYSILENIIRNAAKHGFANDDKNKLLEIDISIEKSKQSDYFIIRITDNIPLKTDSQVIAQLKKYLMEDLINESHKLVDDHKGLKEILISALWLCGENVANISNEKREQYIEVTKSETNCLQYVFYLYRAKSLLVICDEKQLKNEFSDYTCIDYFAYMANRERCKRYNLVVDCTDGFKLDKEKEGFRRYLKDTAIPQSTLDEKLYIQYFKRFLSDSFGSKVLESTKFLISIDETKVAYSHEVTSIKDPILNAMFPSESKRIQLNSDEIYAGLIDVKKIIAFRRHLQDMPGDFLTSDHNYDINKSHRITLQKIDEVKKQYVNLESITGNNSSFSMIANAAIDDLWVLRQLEAGYAKILIIDERLFDTFSTLAPKHAEESESITRVNNKENDCTKAIFMSLKNVDITNIDENTLVNLWDREIGWYDSKNHSFKFKEGHAYHYISVHQGILDKLFNLYGKEFKNRKDDFFARVLDNLKKNAAIKCLIHTGRGKPNYITGRMAYRSLSDLDDSLKEPKVYLLDYFNCASYE